MNNYLALTKALIKNTFRPLSKTQKKWAKPIIFFLLIGCTLLPLEIFIVAITSASYSVLKTIGQEGLVLSLGLSAVSSVIFFFGIFYIISVFYFSKDVETFLSLPFKPWEILGAKFTITLLYEYITEMLFFLPIVITYGVISNAGFLYYVCLLFVFICLPVIPLILSSVLDILIMSFTNLSKNRDLFKIFGGIVAIMLSLGINIFVQRYAANMSSNQLINLLLQGHNSATALTSRLFPSAKYGVLALLNYSSLTGLGNLLIFFALNVLFLILFMLIANLLYFKGAIGSSEVSTKTHKNTKNVSINIVQRSALIAYTIKELRLLYRTPIYFMNCILMNFIWPIFIFIPFIVKQDVIKELDKIRLILQVPAIGSIILVIMAAIGIFISATNGISSTAISREGQTLFVSKYLPIKFELQILAKVLSSVFIGGIGLIFITIPAEIMFKLPIHYILLGLTLGLLGTFFTSFAGILIDLNYPKLVWDNEQKAVKQNLNVLLSMLVSAITAGIIVAPVLLLKPSVAISFTGIVTVLGLIDFILFKITKSKGTKLFENIEI